jgi:hypothetical protein
MLRLLQLALQLELNQRVNALPHHVVREVYEVRDALALERELQQAPFQRALNENQ